MTGTNCPPPQPLPSPPAHQSHPPDSCKPTPAPCLHHDMTRAGTPVRSSAYRWRACACACACKHTNKNAWARQKEGTGRAQVQTVDRVVGPGQYKPNMRHGDWEPSCHPSWTSTARDSKPPCPMSTTISLTPRAPRLGVLRRSPTMSLLHSKLRRYSLHSTRNSCLLDRPSLPAHSASLGDCDSYSSSHPPVHPAELSGPQ
jgi:hypothetical protein